MARKPADLRSAMQAARGGAAPRRQAASPSEEASGAAEQIRKARSASAPPPQVLRDPHFRPGRAEMTNVTGYFPPAVKKLLRMIAAEEETTIQELMAEALNDLFAKRGKPEIAPREDAGEGRGGRRARTKSGDRAEARA
jgi:hypothetical protein